MIMTVFKYSIPLTGFNQILILPLIPALSLFAPGPDPSIDINRFYPRDLCHAKQG